MIRGWRDIFPSRAGSVAEARSGKYLPTLLFSWILFLQFSCASTSVAPSTVTKEEADSVDPLWSAVHRVVLNYPIRDLSEQDRFIESDWIYEGKFSRYQFFITITEGGNTFPSRAGSVADARSGKYSPLSLEIEIQNQRRTSPKSGWQWSAPSLDKEAKLRQAIDVELQKSF